MFPIYDKKLRKQLIQYFDIQWNDNTKARILDHDLTNGYRPREESGPIVRAQRPIRSPRYG